MLSTSLLAVSVAGAVTCLGLYALIKHSWSNGTGGPGAGILMAIVLGTFLYGVPVTLLCFGAGCLARAHGW